MDVDSTLCFPEAHEKRCSQKTARGELVRLIEEAVGQVLSCRT